LLLAEPHNLGLGLLPTGEGPLPLFQSGLATGGRLADEVGLGLGLVLVGVEEGEAEGAAAVSRGPINKAC
jgi:hypothetical protein